MENKTSEAMKAIGRHFHEERIRKKLSTRDVAEKCGLSHSYISLIEKGDRTNVGIEKLLTISEVFGINFAKLLAKHTKN